MIEEKADRVIMKRTTNETANSIVSNKEIQISNLLNDSIM